MNFNVNVFAANIGIVPDFKQFYPVFCIFSTRCSKLANNLKYFFLCSLSLLLVQLCSYNSAVCYAPVVADVFVFISGGIVNAWRIGRCQKCHLGGLCRLVDAIHPLDRSLDLGAEGEVVDRSCKNETFSFGHKRIEFLHIIFLDAGAVAFSVAVFAGKAAGDFLAGDVVPLLS